MRAVVMDEFGGPEVLHVEEVDRPTPGPGQVLVRVVVSGTNPVEAKLRQGMDPDLDLPAILGGDVSGVVEQVGPGVHDVENGAEVFYTPEVGAAYGSYAEYNVVAAAIVAPKPASLDHEHAAAVPLAGGTAWEGVVRRLGVGPGETLLVHGGSGGVGSFAVQFGRAAGARVLATASADNQVLLSEIGAEPIDYEQQDFVEVALDATGGDGVDAVFDTVGGENVARSTQATRAFGRLATIVAPGGEMTDLYQRNQVLHGIMLTRERRRLEEMTPLLERGQVRPVVSDVLPLDRVVDAHRRLDTGHGRGKVVLRVV